MSPSRWRLLKLRLSLKRILSILLKPTTRCSRSSASVLTQKDGQYTAEITLSGTGYDMLYCGTAELAASDSAHWISYSGEYNYEDEGEAKTGYVFNIPVSAVNQSIPVAAHSVKKDEWMDRMSPLPLQ